MATNDGGPAFPWHSDGMAEDYAPTQGMSLRDYMASKAMQGMLANHELNMTAKKYATVAYKFADAMLSAREAKP